MPKVSKSLLGDIKQDIRNLRPSEQIELFEWLKPRVNALTKPKSHWDNKGSVIKVDYLGAEKQILRDDDPIPVDEYDLK